MKTINLPIMITRQTGKSFKVLQVNGNAGIFMHPHFSTKEAVIIVQKGSAVLKMNEKDYLLKQIETFIIPAGVKHSLTINEDFQAIVIMEKDSEIKFVTN